jgi:peptidase C25-like protein
MMARTPSGLFATDGWFGEGRKQGVREVAIGRLPVATAGELAELVRKIQAREAAREEPWTQSILLVADDPDNAGNFPQSSEGVAARFAAGVPLSRAYLSVDGLAGVRNAIVGSVDQGTGAVVYFGHGGYDRLADEGVLTSADVAAFTNVDRPTVLAAMTCLAGSSALPGYATLGELLLRQPGGGAAAVWGPSGMSENDLAEPLAQAFFSRRGRDARLGDAVVLARRAYRAGQHPAYMLSIYNLLGDPAMRWP